MKRKLISIFVIVLLSSSFGAPFSQWITVPLKDGRSIRIWGEGDEYSAYFESEDGHAVIYDTPLNGYCYAEKDKETGALISTGIMVGHENQYWNTIDKIPLHLRDTSVAAEEERLRRIHELDELTEMSRRWEALKKRSSPPPDDETLCAPPSKPTLGTIIGLTILVDFPAEDGSDTTLAQQIHPDVTKTDIENLFNAENFTSYNNACSVLKYFNDVSGGKLCYTNIVVGWITMPNPRSHYDNISSRCDYCARPLIQEVFEKIRGDPEYSTKYEPLLQQLTLGDYSAPKGINIYFAGEASTRWNYGLWAHKGSFGGSNWGKAYYTVDKKT